ncbi:nuclear protein MDM1 isoform X1, partial [Lates japonicus]
MTVRFKCKSEYQKNYGVPRSRSVSPQRCTPLAGLRSDQMGISREPSLQRRKKLGSGGLAQSCTSLLCPSDPQHSLSEPTHARAHRKVPSVAASKSRSAFRKEPSLDPEPPTPPESRAHPESPEQPETPAGPRPAADPGRPERPQRAAAQSAEPGTAGKSGKYTTSRPPTVAPDGHRPSANEDEHAMQWRAGLRSGGQRSGGHRSEYHRQFSWKKPIQVASPILTAEQVLYSSNRSVPPFKKNPGSMETEYRRSFQGLALPTGPRLRKHLEHQRAPLFHTHM